MTNKTKVTTQVVEQDKLKRVLQLEGQIKFHDHMYFNMDTPVISDGEYDELVSEYNTLVDQIPGYQSGLNAGMIPVDQSLIPIDIIEPMISISKRKTVEDLNKWRKVHIGSTEEVWEDKLDGMALRLVYEKGYLRFIHTRGNGKQGGDVSHRRHLLKNIPDHVEMYEDKDRVEVTGEAFCMFADFDAYVERHELNPDDIDTRSTVSGLMKKSKSSERDDLPIYFKAYNASVNVRSGLETYSELRDHFTSVGFDIPMLIEGDLLQELLQLTSKPTFGYPIDGLVVKMNDLRKWETEQGSDYYSYATCYKFPTVSLKTRVVGIDWSLSTTGHLVGTLIYEPIVYDGTTMTRCKLDYADTYFERGLRIGSLVEITKSNEIIPKLVSLVETGNGQKLKYPEKCPFCQKLVVVEGPNSVRCINDNCEGQMVKRLFRLSSINGFNIKGLAEKRIEVLIDNGMLKEPQDIFKLTEKDLINVGIDESTAGKIIEQISALNDLDIHRWLFALGIPGLGGVRAIEISNMSGKIGIAEGEGLKWDSLESLMFILKSTDAMCALFGLDGMEMVKFVLDKEDIVTKFLGNYDFTRSHIPALDGVPVAISGAWNVMTRQQFSDIMRDNGYLITDTVTKNVKALLVGTKPSPSKVSKAEKNNLPVIQLGNFTSADEIVRQLLSLNSTRH